MHFILILNNLFSNSTDYSLSQITSIEISCHMQSYFMIFFWFTALCFLDHSLHGVTEDKARTGEAAGHLCSRRRQPPSEITSNQGRILPRRRERISLLETWGMESEPCTVGVKGHSSAFSGPEPNFLCNTSGKGGETGTVQTLRVTLLLTGDCWAAAAFSLVHCLQHTVWRHRHSYLKSYIFWRVEKKNEAIVVTQWLRIYIWSCLLSKEAFFSSVMDISNVQLVWHDVPVNDANICCERSRGVTWVHRSWRLTWIKAAICVFGKGFL